MSSPLRANDHVILKKVSDQVLPLIITGQRVKRQCFVRMATLYAYGGELATGLAGLGVGAPLVALFHGKVEDGKSGLDVLREALPGFWFWVGVVALVLWFCLRLAVKQQNAVDRALFARDCSQTAEKLNAQLEDVLAEAEPMPKIAPIQEALRRMRSEAIEKRVWPQAEQDIEVELRTRVNQIREKHMAEWAAPPTGVT
jgi:hypothetical protein